MGRLRGAVRRHRDDLDRRGWLRGAPPPWWVRALPVVLLVGVCLTALVAHEPMDIGFVLGAIPPLAVLSYGPLATAVLGGLSVALLNVTVLHLDRPGNTDVLTIVFVAVLSVFVSFVRSHRDAQLVTERTVAEAAQRAVAPPLPPRVGPVLCSGFYRAAQRGTLVGGDFFDVRESPRGVRAVMGDVQGHGLSAVARVAALLGAFREAVLDQPDLTAVAGRLDRRLEVDSAADPHSELFATCLLLEFSPDTRTVRIMTCGHPSPLLLRGGAAIPLDVVAGMPLGLGLGGVRPRELSVPLRADDRLFAVSDGVTEARDGAGMFYPLTERLAAFAGERPKALTRNVWDDLLAYTGVVQDDVTMLVLTPVGVSTPLTSSVTAARSPRR